MSVYDFVSQGTPDDIVERYAALKNDAEASDFGDLDRNVVILDTETTGFSQNHDELTQIACRPPRTRCCDGMVRDVRQSREAYS